MRFLLSLVSHWCFLFLLFPIYFLRVLLSLDASASFCAVSQSTDLVCRVSSSVSTSSSSMLLDPTGLAPTLASEVVEKPQEVDESFQLTRPV